jgi:hypothetical protein
MKKDRTASVPGWWVALQAALLQQMPRPEEIDQTTAEGWFNNQRGLKRALAKALLPTIQRVTVFFKGIMDCTIGLPAMIKACGCNYIHSDINEKNFPIQSPGKVAVELVLVTVTDILDWLCEQGQDVVDHNCVSTKAVFAFMVCHGLYEAFIEHLLFCGINCPDEQRESKIIALGSIWVDDNGERHYAYLDSDCGSSDLLLRSDWLNEDDLWEEDCRFLAFRL